MKAFCTVLTAVLLVASPSSRAEILSVYAKIDLLSVNGGQDTTNPGTTCMHLTMPVSAACPSGYIAIRNNNKELLAAAMIAKSAGSHAHVHYETTGAVQHCPQMVFTPCTVVNIIL